jgi:hypothetical protein
LGEARFTGASAPTASAVTAISAGLVPMSFSIWRMSEFSSLLQRVIEMPVAPARPVRPMRCT